MFTAWRSAFIGLTIFSANAIAYQSPHEETSALGFEPIELKGPSQAPTQPATTKSADPVEQAPSLVTTPTPPPPPPEPTSNDAAREVISANPYPNSGNKAPPINIPHSQTTVAGENIESILQAPAAPVGGGGHNPLPEPETTVPGNEMSSLLGGPGAGPPVQPPPEGTSLPNVPKDQPGQTFGEPQPITALPAPTIAPAPIQTSNPSPPIAQESPADPDTVPAQPIPTVVKPPPIITIGSSAITADSSSQFTVGTQTLAVGGPPITHSGVVLSLPSSGEEIIIGPSTQIIQPVMPTPGFILGGTSIVAHSASEFVIGKQTLQPGAAPVTIDGQTLSLSPTGSAVVVNGQVQNLATSSPIAQPVITIGNAQITANSASQFIVGGQTLEAGKSPITVSGQIVSIASSGNAVVFGPSTQAFVNPPMVLSTSLPILTIGGSTIAADASSNYVIAGQTIRPGGSAITVHASIISIAPSATALVVGGSTQALTPSPVLATTLPPLITLDGQTLRANAASDYVLGGQTLKPGHAITVSGSVILLAPGASNVVIDGSTQALTPQLISLTTGLPALTICSSTITADADGDYVLSGQTVRPGADAVTIDGQMVSLASNDSFLVVGTTTQKLYGATETGGTVSRSKTRMTSTTKATATASFTANSAPTLVVSAPAEPTEDSGGSRTPSTGWACMCGMLMFFMLIWL
ncbi:MAG: hypothetical protein Q9221_005690 [Calogaya cf. arnoldii]